MRGDTAVIEMARASGLALVAGRNDPLRATTFGTGELIRAALDAGVRRVIVAVGGSATVDGGLGALEALDFDLRGADVVVACDVTTPFVDAARVFGPQKGAGRRCRRGARATARAARRALPRRARGRRPRPPGRGRGRAASRAASPPSARGSSPALRSSPTSSACATRCGTRRSSLTGEGRVDATSFVGKVVGHVLARGARAADVPVAVVAGDAERAALPNERRVPDAGRARRLARGRARATPLTSPPTAAAALSRTG